MRKTDRKNGFSLQAISGTRAIMLAMNGNQASLDDFLGFAVGTRSGDGEIHWLRGFKYFPSLVPDAVRGQRFSTAEHPIQDFKWGHYWAEPETDYNFVVRPLFRPDNGDLANLRAGTDLEVTIRTESETGGRHSILFNRGAKNTPNCSMMIRSPRTSWRSSSTTLNPIVHSGFPEASWKGCWDSSTRRETASSRCMVVFTN